MQLVVVASTSGELKSELLSPWILYDVAPLTHPHTNVGGHGTVVSFAGSLRVGAAGGHRILTVHTVDHDPHPHVLRARTRQEYVPHANALPGV